MSDRKYREGEVVENMVTNVDENGLVESEVIVRWYGMDNHFANRMTMDIVDALKGKVQEWDAVKNGPSK